MKVLYSLGGLLDFSFGALAFLSFANDSSKAIIRFSKFLTRDISSLICFYINSQFDKKK